MVKYLVSSETYVKPRLHFVIMYESLFYVDPQSHGKILPQKFIHLQQGFLILCASCYFFSISSSPLFYAFHFFLNNYCSMKEIDQDTLWNIWCVCNLVFPIPTSSHPMALSCAFTTNVCNCHHKSKTRNRTRKKLSAIYHEKRGEKRKILDRGVRGSHE